LTLVTDIKTVKMHPVTIVSQPMFQKLKDYFLK